MNIFETTRIAWRALIANKLRSSLAMLGIIIGVAAVIAIMSVGETFKQTISGEFNKFGAGVFFIVPGDGKSFGPPPISTLTYEDEKALASSLPIEKSGSFIETGAQVAFGETAKFGMIMGSNEHFEDLRNWNIEQGSFFTKADVEGKKPVGVIGKSLRDQLFGKDADPIGQQVKFQGADVKVVGVLKANNLNAGIDINNVLVLPNSFLAEKLDVKKPTSILVRFKTPDIAKANKGKVEQLLMDRHGVKDFAILSQDDILATFGKILDNVTIFIGAVAGIALLVGGIGIMNIMLVSVKERTREIGVRKAIGARRGDILKQFLVEAATLSLLGGCLGILLGLGMAYAGARYLAWEFVPSTLAIILGFGFSTMVGIFFGFYPAFTASRLPAVEALRYE